MFHPMIFRSSLCLIIMNEENKILRPTRLNIFQILKRDEINWSGRLSDADFLSRLYDLESMPSRDPRNANAKWDIITHTINWPGDWDDYWIFEDKRFNLMECDDKEFVDFLCEMIHPIVRPNQNEREVLLKLFNEELKDNGYEIVEAHSVLGKLRYEPKNVLSTTLDALDVMRDEDILSTENIQRQITRMRSNIEKDPELAIGSSKEFIEAISKTILDALNIQYNNENLPKLTKMVLKELSDGNSHSAETASVLKRIDSALTTLVQSIGELRNKHGTGHGGGKDKIILDQKYASLAVNSASTIALFFFQLYKEKTNKKH